MTRLSVAAAVAISMLTLSGCALVYKPAGQVLTHYAQDNAVPYALKSDDFNMSSCGTGLALTQLLGSFSRVVSTPNKTLLSTNLLAGLCSERNAQKAHLRVIRDLNLGDTDAARDDRIIAQRYERRTAERRYRVYKHTNKAFGKLGDGCPDVSGNAEAQYLVGMLTSVQGLLNDIKANSSVGIPKDVAARAGRASQCFDNDKWWGVPNALQAVVWLSVPGTAPDDAKPWAQLKRNAQQGVEDGVALAPMLYALAAQNASKTDMEKQAIKLVAQAYNAKNATEQYRLLNQVSYIEARYLSDRIWMNAENHRTPLMALGSFPGGNENSDNANAARFLN